MNSNNYNKTEQEILKPITTNKINARKIAARLKELNSLDWQNVIYTPVQKRGDQYYIGVFDASTGYQIQFL